MHITLIVCTYNRADSLARMLVSVTRLRAPATLEYEILVVDNNSNDHTRQVVAGFCDNDPQHFRYCFEPQQGKSYALNTGVREAKGEILAFTDDDVTVNPDWLWNLKVALDDERWAGAGGRIFPERTFTVPQWLPIEERYGFAPLILFDLGCRPGQLTEPPFGANMAYRKAMFHKYGGFRTDLGPCPGGSGPQKNEDVEFGRRLLIAGEQLCYEPSAIIYHSVSDDRLKKRYFLSWWFEKSHSDTREKSDGSTAEWHYPIYLVRSIALWTLRWIFTIQARKRFACKLNVWIQAGQLFGILQRHLAPAICKTPSRPNLTLPPATPVSNEDA
jgi:glycosyltransferase involved in cell wall biosynthesis